MPPVYSTQRNGSIPIEDPQLPNTALASAGNVGFEVNLADEEAALDARFEQYRREVYGIPLENLPPINRPEDGQQHMIDVRRRVNNSEQDMFQDIREDPIPHFRNPNDLDRYQDRMRRLLREVRTTSIQVLQAMAEIIAAILKDPVKVSIFSGICAGLGVICRASGYMILTEVVGPNLIFTAVAASACFVLYKTARFVINMRAV